MAARKARPGRTLLAFFLGLAITYGLVALAGAWKPELGLDLQGGTRIQLSAEGDPTPDSLEEARKIIDQRVNGSGVSEAEVTVQGERFIVVEIPGQSRADLEDVVKRQAQLRFRLVACSDQNPAACSAAAPTDPAAPAPVDPGTGVELPSEAPVPTPLPSGNVPGPVPEPSGSLPSGTTNRGPVSYGDETGSPSPAPAPTPTSTDAATPAPTDGESEATEPAPPPEGGEGVGDPITWIESPNQEAVDAFNAFTCPADGGPANVVDDPTRPLVTCEYDPESGASIKYLLSASMIEGTELDGATAEIPQSAVSYVVAIEFNGEGTKKFADISRALVCPSGDVPPCRQFSVVLDGQVLSAPTMNALITNGKAQIEGNFTQQSAESLATSLKFGALPIAFDDEGAVTETIGPSLAGNQLSAGLLAGGFGLALVMIYCLIYYRGLGLVVIASLAVAAAATYALVLLLSETANFTLTLPGIAGLIVAVGITADSFIVYFERIRDEMRDGKSMRVAVESGWVRARATCLAADAVSLLAAVVLFIFAVGVVKGFAFALGLSTLIDLVVFFWFTKPMVSWLAKFRFFNEGHRLSGLDAEALGVDKLSSVRPADRVAVGGRA